MIKCYQAVVLLLILGCSVLQAQSSDSKIAGFPVSYDFPANATVSIVNANPSSISATLRLDNNGSISAANLQISDSLNLEYNYGVFKLNITHANYLASEDVLSCSGWIKMPTIFQEDSNDVLLNFSNLKLNSSGVLDLGEIHTTIPIHYHGFYFGLGSASKIYKDSLVLDGYMVMPHNIAQIHSSLRLETNNAVTLELDSIKGEYLEAFGYDFSVQSGSYQNGVWTIESNLVLPDNVGEIPASAMKIDTSGIVQEPSFSPNATQIKMGVYDAKVSQAWLYDNAIYVNADLNLMGENVHFDSLIISNSGNFLGNNISVANNFSLGGYSLDSSSLVFGKFLIDSLANQKYGFELEARVRLPNNWGFVKITDARIYLDGTFYGGRLNGAHSTQLNGLEFLPDRGKFYPVLKSYVLSGGVDSHADTSIVQIFIDDDLEGYAPMINGKWTYAGVRFPNLLTSDVKVINIIDTDADGEYNTLKDAIFDISDSLKIVSKTGTLGHFKGSSNLLNGSIIEVSLNDQSVGSAVVWDHHWELYDFNQADPASAKLSVTGSKKSDGYVFSAGSLSNKSLVNVEYRGKSLVKVPVDENNAFKSPVFEILNYDPTELKVLAYSDSDNDGIIDLNKDQVEDITGSISTQNIGGTIYRVFGKSSKANGSIVQVSANGNAFGKAIVWDGQWQISYTEGTLNNKSFGAKVYSNLALDSLLEDVSTHLKYQTLVLDEVDFTEWTEYHSFNIDADSLKNASILMEGELTFPGLGKISIDDLDISPSGVRSPGKKDSHGSPHFKFDGYSFTLNTYDLDISKPEIELDGEILLPDNAGNMWARLKGDLNGIQFETLEAEQKEINIGLFDFHIDSLYLNAQNEMVLDGELDVPNLDKYLKLDELVITAGGDRKEASIEAKDLDIKLNDYAFTINDAAFISDTLPNGSFTDTLRFNGIIDLGPLGNITAQNVHLDYQGQILSGQFSVGPKGLKVGGYDFSQEVDSIKFVGNELHLSNINHTIQGTSNTITFKHILIDNQLNFLVDEVLLNNVDLNYRGHAFTADQVYWQKDTVRLSGLLALGDEVGNIELDDVRLLPDGSMIGGEFKPLVQKLSYHGFVLDLDSVLWNEQQQLLTMNGLIELPDSLGLVSLDGLKISPNKVEDYGKISFSNQTISWKGFDFKIDSIDFSEPYFQFKGNINISGIGDIQLVDVKLDAGGNYNGGSFVIPNNYQLDYNGFTLNPTQLYIEEDAVELDGEIVLSDSIGKLAVTNLELQPDGSITGGHFLFEEGSKSPSFEGLDAEVNSVSFENQLLKLHSALELPNNIGRIGVKLSKAANQSFTLDSIFPRNTSITYSGFPINLSDCQYSSGNFTFDGTVDIDSVGSFEVSQLSLSPQGEFVGGQVSYPASSWQWGLLSAQITSTSIVDHKIIMNAQLSLPQNMGSVSIQNLTMDSKGDIISAEMSPGPITYAGYTLNVDSVSLINGDQIKLKGSFTLPNNYGEVDFNNFIIGTDGRIIGGISTYSGDGISIGQFSASIDQVVLKNDSISIDGDLQFPPSIGGKVAFNGLSFTPSGSMGIESIESNGISIQVQGFTCNLSSLSWESASQRIILDGSVVLPKNLGGVSVSALEIGTDGSFYGGNFDLSNLNLQVNGLSFKPSALTLNGSSLVFDGSLSLPDGATISVTGMEVSGSGIENFGQINAQGVQFSWKEYTFELTNMDYADHAFSFSGNINLGQHGTLAVEDLKISDHGEFYGGSFNTNGAQLKFASMAITLDSLDVQSDEFEFSGSLDLPQNNGTIHFHDVDITAKGGLMGGKLVYEGNGFSFKNGEYAVFPTDIAINNNSFTIDARVVETATDSVKAIMTGTTISGDPFNIQFGTETLLNTDIYYKGFDIKVDTFTVSGSDLIYTGSITIPKLGKLDVDHLVLNAISGDITDHGNITYTGQTWTLGQTSFTIDSVKLEEDNIEVKAKMQLPNNAGEVDVNSMLFTTTGTLLSADVDVQGISMGYGNYSIALTHAAIEGSELELDGTIQMNDFGTFNVNDLEFDMTTGTFKTAIVTSDNANFTIGSFTAVPEIIKLENSTLDATGYLKLPSAFGDSARVSFNGFKITGSGDFSIDSINASNVDVKYKGMDLAFTDLKWNEGLVISADLTLPGNSNPVQLQNLKIDKSGNVSGGSISANGVTMDYHGYTLTLADAQFEPGNGVKLSGSFSLPGGAATLSVADMIINESGISDYGSVAMTSNTPIKWHDYEVLVSNVALQDGTVMVDGSMSLSGVATLSVSQMGISSSGTFIPGSIQLTNQQSFKLGQSSVTISEIDFVNSSISFSGSVDFGNNHKVSVSDMTVDFQGNFDGGTIAYSGDPIQFHGASVMPYNMGYENDLFTASASMTLPDSMATVTVTDVEIDHDFNVTIGEVEVSGVSIHYKGVIVNLDSAIYAGEELQLWGNLQNDKLGTLQITDLTMNTKGEITGGKVDYSGTQKFGQLTVTINDLGFDWGKGDITITGSLALPNNIGSLRVDTLTIDPHSGVIKSGTLGSDAPITYGGTGIDNISATINKNEIELDGAAQLPDQLGLITVTGLDVSLNDATISGGSFGYQEQKPITFGGASVSISSLSFDLDFVELTAQITLPSNLGKASVNNAKFEDGKFSLESVTFSGQTLSVKGVSCTVSSGTITESDVKVSVDVSLSDAAKFGINDFMYDYATSTFSGGEFVFEKAEFKYKDFELEILSHENLDNKASFSAQFAIPGSSGYAKIDNIYISLEDGLDFSSMSMDYGSLPNLLPTGFSLTITQHEALNNGILLSGHMDLLGSSVDVEGLKITTDGVDIEGLEIQTPSFKLGSFDMPNLDFAFSKDGNDWEIDISGKADIPDVGALEFSGFVKSDGDFGGQFVLKGAFIELGESGFALYNPGGGVYDTSGVFTVQLFGDVAPIEMQYVYVINGVLTVSSTGEMSGQMTGKLFNMVELQKSYADLNIAKGTIEYDTEFSYGIKTPPKTGVIKKVDAITQKIPTIDFFSYGGGFHISTFTGFEISGSGNAVLVNVQVGEIDLDVDDKHFQFTANFHIPQPGGGSGADLVSCVGDVSIDFDAGSGELYGAASVLGHQLANMDFKFGPDTIAAVADINLQVGQFDVAFQTSKHSDGKHHLDYFHGDAYIGFGGMTFAEMEVDVTESAWSGSAHAWVPGFGSEIDVSINGTPTEVTYFDGYEAFRVFNIQLEEAEFKYQKENSKKYISFNAHGSLPHFGRSSFDVELEQSGSHWALTHLDGEVDAYVDVNLPVFGHWHKELGEATIDYDRSRGKLDVSLHTSLLNVGIVRVTDIFAHVYFHEPSATVGVGGHYGLGKHTYHLKKLHCHYHWCCHASCHWENCCYWTVNLGDKDFKVSVTVKGPSLPSPPKEKPLPPAPAPIVVDCSVDHIQAASVCNGTDYNHKTFDSKFLIATEFHQGKMHHSKMYNSDFTSGIIDGVDMYSMTFEDTKLKSATIQDISNANYVYFKGNTSLDQATFKTSTFKHLTVQDLTVVDWAVNDVTFSNSTLKNLSLRDQQWNKLTISSSALSHILMDAPTFSDCDFSGNTFTQVTLQDWGSVSGTSFENASFSGCHLDSVNFASDTKFNGASFSATVLENLNFTSSTELKNLTFSNNSSLVNVIFKNADISGGSLTSMELGNINMIGAIANDMNLTAITLAGSRLTNADFTNSNFNNVDAHNSNLEGVKFNNVMFTNSNLNHVTVNNSTSFDGATFSNTDLQGVDFTNNPNLRNIVVYGSSDLHAVNFEGANLTGAKFYNVAFHRTNFKDAILREVEFHNCTFDTIDFQSATLSRAKFIKPSFVGFTDFHAAAMDSIDLSDLGTNFENTNLSGVEFIGANLRGMNFAGSTIDFANFDGADLTNANLKGCFGRPLTMLKFDGQDDYLQVPMEPTLLDYYPNTKPSHSGNFDGNRRIEVMLNGPETEVTHEMWFKTTHGDGGLFSAVLYSKGALKQYDRHIFLKNGDIYARVWNNEVIHSSGTNYADGNWHHVAHVMGSSINGQKLYIDGQQVASGSKTKSDQSQDRILIGYSHDAGSKYFRGQIDEVRIWRKALSQSTIKAWHTKPVSFDHPDFEKLLAYYPFDEGSGDWTVNKAFTGMLSNWQANSSANSETGFVPTQFNYGPNLKFEKEITLETWAKGHSSTWNDDAVLINKREGFFLHPKKGTNELTFYHRQANNANHNLDWKSGGNVNTWRHYAAVLGNGKAKLYIDGVLVSSSSTGPVTLINDMVPIHIGKDDYGSRQALDGNMSRVNVWAKAFTDAEIKERAGLKSHASLVTPLHPHYKYLRLSMKNVAWDKGNYSFNGRFVKEMNTTDGKWSSENAPLILPIPLTNAERNGGRHTTIEMNVMAETNNNEVQVLLEHKRSYSAGDEVKAFHGFDIRRDADRKISFHLFRKVFQKTTVYEKYIIPVVNVEDSAVWDHELDDRVEENLAFHIKAYPTHFRIEFFVNGESKGVKNLQSSNFHDLNNGYFFNQLEGAFSSSAQHLVAAGSNMKVKNYDSDADFDDLGGRTNLLNGYLFDLRVWDTLVKSETINEWRLKDVTLDHPNYRTLKVNYSMNDGASSVQNHGENLQVQVHYGDWIRLKHQSTNFELASENHPYGYKGHGPGVMVAATPNTTLKNWWRVMPIKGANFNQLKGKELEAGDKFILVNAKNNETLTLNGNHIAYRGNSKLKSVAGYSEQMLSPASYWTMDSITVYRNDQVISTSKAYSGSRMFMKFGTGKHYLYSDAVRGDKKDVKHIYGLQRVGVTNSMSENNIWIIEEIQHSLNKDTMYGKSEHMPSYITLPNFDAATLKNTTMPDGTVK